MSKEAIEKKIFDEIHDNPDKYWGLYHNGAHPSEILSLIESLGYVQPKFSEDLEKAITELAELIYSERNIRNKEGLKIDIGHWLSANRLAQKVDQSLPENPHNLLIGYQAVYGKAQQDMLRAGWVKVKELK